MPSTARLRPSGGFPLSGSFCGFLGHRPYVVRLLDVGETADATSEWLIEMPGLPAILFPGTSDDEEATIRRKAEHLLRLVIPEG